MSCFPLSKPIVTVLSGVHGPRHEVQIAEVQLRSVNANDLRLIEDYKGLPASLAIHGTASLSGLSVAQVKKIDIDDYAPIAVEVLRRLSAAARMIGVKLDYFDPSGDGAARVPR